MRPENCCQISLRAGERNKTDLVHEVRESTGLSKPKVQRALKDHTGRDASKHEYWSLEIGDSNANIYRLNWGGV